MNLEFSESRITNEPTAKLRKLIEKESSRLDFLGAEPTSVSIKIRFTLDLHDTGYGFGIKNRVGKSFTAIGYPWMSAEHRSNNSETVPWEQRWFMHRTVVATNKRLHAGSSAMPVLNGFCEQLIAFFEAVMPGMAKFKGSMELNWAGILENPASARQIRFNLNSRSIMIDGEAVCGLPCPGRINREATVWTPA